MSTVIVKENETLDFTYKPQIFTLYTFLGMSGTVSLFLCTFWIDL